MTKHLFKLIGIAQPTSTAESKYVELSKWATVEEALEARSLAFKEQEECMQTGEQIDYLNFIILVEY